MSIELPVSNTHTPEDGEWSRSKIRDYGQRRILELMKEVVADNRARDKSFLQDFENLDTKPFVYAVDGEVGLGKSNSLIQFLNSGGCDSCIIFVEQIKTCDDLVNGTEHSDAIEGLTAIHGKMDNKKGTVYKTLIDVMHSENYKHIVMTHESLRELLDKGSHDVIFPFFELVVVDESFSSHDTLTSGVAELTQLYATLTTLDTPESDDMVRFIKRVNSKEFKEGEYVSLIPTYHLDYDELDKLLEQVEVLVNDKNKFTSKPALLTKDFIHNLRHSHDRVAYLQKEGGNTFFIAARNFFPTNRSMIILSDGISQEGGLLALEKYNTQIDVKKERISRGSWSNYHIHWERNNTGKASTTTPTKKDREKLIEVMSQKPKGVAICHQGLIDKLLADKILKDVDGRLMLNKVEFIWWGVHHSRNDMTGYKNIYITSLYHKPARAVSSPHMSNVDTDTYKQGDYESTSIPLDTLYADIKQFIGRANRSLLDHEINIYTVFPNENDAYELLSRMASDCPNMDINWEQEHWYGVGSTKREKILEKVEEVVAYCNENLGSKLLDNVPLSQCVEDNKYLANIRSKDKPIWRYFLELLTEYGYTAEFSGRMWRVSKKV